MKPPPFAISSRALAAIENALAAVKDPKFARMVPSLCFCLNSRSRTQFGRTFSWISVGQCRVGLYRAESVTGWARFYLCGREFALHEDVLRRLKGKRLVVRAVPSGYPDRHFKTTKVLRAVPVRPRKVGNSN